MPKGIYHRKPRTPRQYPGEMVAKVRALYDFGHTQEEIAASLLTTQKVIWRLMERHGIKARVAAKRDQRGPRNHSWKGDAAKYAAAHLRVKSIRGTPSRCEQCGTTDARKKYDWASLTHNYTDVNDYKRLCRSCHHVFDGKARNLGDNRRLITHDGQTLSLSEWAVKTGIKLSTLWCRLKAGRSIEDTLNAPISPRGRSVSQSRGKEVRP